MLRSFRLSKFRRKSRNHPASAEEKEEWEIGLHSAASLGDVDKVKSLLTKGAKVNMVNEHGNTALHEAAWKGYSQTVEILCNHGADVYMKNKSGFSALHLTCQNGHNQSCRLLLLAGCKPDIKNNYGDTPLHTAARYGHAGVARILISAHCHANEINKNGDTALHISSAMGRSKLTQIIVDAGCEPLIKNKQRETALEIAKRKQFHEIELMLLKKSNNIHLPIRKLAKRCNKCSGTSQSSSTDKLDKHSKTNYLKRRGSRKVPKLHKHCASPYGCHMFPDSSSFPSPKLDSLPAEPLTTGEQYYIDLAGNIKKGPTGYGHSYCCKPFFRHMEKALETEKSHIMNQVDCAHKNLSTRIDSLEQRTQNYLHYLSQTMEEKLKSERKECLGRYEKHSKCKIRDTKNKNAKAVDLHSVSHHNLGISLDPNAEVNKNLPGSRHPLMWTSQRSQSEEALVMSNSNSEMQSPMHIAEIMWLAASEDNLLERIPHNRETLNYYDDFNNLRYSQHSNTEFKNQLKFQSNLNIYQSNHCSFTETHRTSLYDIRSCNNLINKKNLLLDNYVQLNKLLNDASQNKMYNGLNRTATAVKRTQPATCV